MAAEPFLDVGQAGRVQIGHRSDRGMAIGVVGGEQPLGQLVAAQAVRLVVALPLLVLDDATLHIQRVLRDRPGQIAHAIGFEEQRAVQRRGRHRLEIIGAVETGGAVQVGRADLLQRFEEVARRILAAVEHQMLEQVREAGLALRLVLRPDVIPHADRDDRRLAIGVDDHAQPVLQRELRKGDVDRLDQRGDGRGGGRAARGLRGGGGDREGGRQDGHGDAGRQQGTMRQEGILHAMVTPDTIACRHRPASAATRGIDCRCNDCQCNDRWASTIPPTSIPIRRSAIS